MTRTDDPAQGRGLVVHTDGGSRGNPGHAGYGAVVTDAASGAVLAERSEYIGIASNNVAEYRAVVAGLEAAKLIDPECRVEVRADSKLVVEQMSGRWKIKHPDMKELALEARAILPRGRVTYTWVPRAENAEADALANKAMDARAATNTDAWRDEGDERDEQDTSDAPEPATVGSAERPLHVPMGRPAGTPATVLLVRHGVTTQTLSGTMAGGDTAGPELADAGREQARRAAEIARRAPRTWSGVEAPDHLIASPLLRTRQTAAILAEELGLEAREDERLAEVLFGEWQGRASREVEVEEAEHFADFIGTGRTAAPGGESLLDVGRRMGAFLSEIAESRSGHTVLAVSHSVAIRSALGLALGADPGRWWMLRISPASVSVLRLWPAEGPEDGPRVEVVALGVPGELLDA